jgi:NDP-sugar pyrophosphorylase family protein
MIRAHRAARRLGCLATIATHVLEDLIPANKERTAYGVLSLNEERRVMSFVEKPEVEQIRSKNVASAGVFILNKKVLSRFPEVCPVDLSRDVMAVLAAGSSRVFAFELEKGFRVTSRE